MEKNRIESLVNRAQSGDLQAMEKLLEAAHTSVSYQCRKMMPRQEDAEDLTQEVLLAVYQKIDTLKEAKAFWSWLHRITAAHCMNALSRNHVDLQFAEDEEGHSVVDDLEVLDEHSIPDKALDNAETARMIDEIVSGLPEAQRMSTLLYYYNEMSVKEIAQIMNVPENTVKSRLNLARKAIKDKVLDYEKQGVKLYSVSILPFLWYFLRTAAESQANTGAAAACASGVITTATVATTTAATTGATVTGTVTTGIAAKIAAMPIVTKIISSIVALIITATAIIGITNLLSSREEDISQNPNESTETSTLSSDTDLPTEDYTNYYLIDPFDAIEYICYVEESKSFVIRQMDNYAKEYDNGWKINNIGKRDDGGIYVSRAGSADDDDYGYFLVNEDSYNGNKVTVKFVLSKDIIGEYKKLGVIITDFEKEFVVTKGEYVKDATALESLSLYDIKGFKRGCRVFFWSDKKDADSDTENLFEFVTEYDWSSMTNTTGCSIYFYKNLIISEQGEIITQGNGTTIYNSQMYSSDEAFVSIDDYISTYYIRWISQIELIDY